MGLGGILMSKKEELKKKHVNMQLIKTRSSKITDMPVEKCNVEFWPACCCGLCTYVGDAGLNELKDAGLLEEFLLKCQILSWDLKDKLEKGQITSHLYQCSLCGKYYMSMDAFN
jgi:uncharacterized protein CbrC (UPF0167 family)